MQRQIDELITEGEKMKRWRVAAVTPAAKQMVLDVQKERLLDEFVKDLIQELEESQRVVGKMKEAHEHEILELTGEWTGEYRKLAREVERLKLAREASLVEQDLLNDLERRMVVGRVDNDVEVMSNMTSSTCVEFNESPPSSAKARISRESPKRTHRRSSLALKVPHAVSSKPLSPLSPIRKLDTGPYVGFSFNPLFFGHTESTLSEANEKITMHDSTSVVESRCRTLSLKLPQHHLHESGESASVHLDPNSFSTAFPCSQFAFILSVSSAQCRLLALHHGRTASSAQLCAWTGRRWSGNVREEAVASSFVNVCTNLLCDVVAEG
jgi:hypothetical protein